MTTTNTGTTAYRPTDVPVGVQYSQGLASGQKTSAMTNHALEAKAIAKSYVIGGQSRPVLDGIDFHVDPGECVFLAGPSGSGKTTLLSILGLLLTSDSGQLLLKGRRVDGLTEGERTLVRRERIGFVFQRFQLINGLTAEDNVSIPLTMDGMPLREARDRAGALLCRMGLEDHRKALPTSMSPGQCQRVALARAVINEPELILADEPTAALDGKSGQAVMELLHQLTKEFASSTVVVTHDPRIYQYADRICEMENGKFK
ncbi:Macrolide export ATP-binding/permease protein MacB [Stieleria neptunia]|uniref:Macrolide export ATP-binding/permease protein MacB n=1 Tax=Stieleria neptunia TaxID=2527979 RepID=A0A518HR48_9BACT|nr:ABC transporter ATP-binding protein [Stieleria neptunia]QDV43271.1 Macrolide export ATP-binding/permease protein MacB [Stieleria neptunia]